MSTLNIELENGKSTFMPGETMAGIAMWNLDDRPKSIEMRLFWYTSGKGTRDTETVDFMELDHPKASGAHSFEFTIPSGPYSFSGTLVSLTWALEMIVEPKNITERTNITVSSTGVEVNLKAYMTDEECEEDEGLSLEEADDMSDDIQ